MTADDDETPYLGVIEGFFGRSWTFQERFDYAKFLKDSAYQFYIYAPKSDPYLRKSWQQDWPTKTEEKLQSLVKQYHLQGLDFGVGLSPFEIYRNYDESAQKKLAEKVGRLNKLGVDILCLLFDDMRGDLPDLAKTQIQITKDVLAKTTAKKVIMCPTYYSFDPVLEKVFGTMPENYLEDLGSGLPLEVDIFWTGEKVCSKEYPDSHLEKVQQLLKRKLFLWDNYPVNDGAKMSKYLHLKAFQNRSNNLNELSSGHAVNPMNQAYLSRIPLQTLPQSYHLGDKYQADKALEQSLQLNLGNSLAKQIEMDINCFQKEGLDNIELDPMIKKYAGLESPYATEIVAWLQGEYAFDPECLTD
jgi:hypothetical protein